MALTEGISYYCLKKSQLNSLLKCRLLKYEIEDNQMNQKITKC